MKKRLLEIATELAVMLFMVLLFFAILAAILLRIFPSGVTLTQILERKGESGGGERRQRGLGAILGLERGGQQGEVVATLARTGNEVMRKGAGSIAWASAQQGMKLRDRDAIQTFRDSSAQINFDSRNYLTMGSNSLVIIKGIEAAEGGTQRRSSVVVVDGELEGRLAPARDKLRLHVSTLAAGVTMLPGPPSAASADFRISVNPDRSSNIVVLRGVAEVSAKGKTVRVPEKTGVQVRRGEEPGPPVPLPEPPELLSPSDGAVLRYRELPPQVAFRWSTVKGSECYHLQVARDQGFKRVLLDTRVGRSGFVHGNLIQGTYFWRVSSIRDGLEGERSGARKMATESRLSPPPLRVDFPEQPVEGELLLLTGATDPGNRVFVAGEPVATDATGAFSRQVPLRRGINLVTVEAVDPAGNVSYRSRYVKGRF